MTVQQLLHNMDSFELTEWMAFYEIREKEMAKRKRM